MNYRWFASYPAGVPEEIDLHRYSTLTELLDAACSRNANADAMFCLGRTLRYRDVHMMADSFAAWLQSVGVKKGDRVALMLPNVLQYPIALLGSLRAGCVAVGVNPLYTARELQQQLSDCGAVVIVVLDRFAEVVERVLPSIPARHVVIASLGDLLGTLKGLLVNSVAGSWRHGRSLRRRPLTVTFQQVLEAGRASPLSPPTLAPDDLALLQYTGGTTGASKGAMLTHRNVVAAILMCEAWVAPAREGREDERWVTLCALPLFHIFGLTIGALLSMHLGGLSVLVPNPRNIAALVKDYARFRVSSFPGVNTLYEAVLRNPAFAALDHSGLVCCNGGAMPIRKSTAEAWLAATGCHICEGYGLSECAPTVTGNDVVGRGFNGTVGVPLPSTVVQIVDNDGQELPAGVAGEVVVRGPQVMAGYWNRPVETAAVLQGGFLRTGDIGVMSDRGIISLVDRKKDVILVSGFSVYPSEVEMVLSRHPAVLECAVVGVPDARSGEAVKAFVVPHGEGLQVMELMEFCASQLTGYKRPRTIELVAQLPKNGLGKVLRRELRPAPSSEQAQLQSS